MIVKYKFEQKPKYPFLQLIWAPNYATKNQNVETKRTRNVRRERSVYALLRDIMESPRTLQTSLLGHGGWTICLISFILTHIHKHTRIYMHEYKFFWKKKAEKVETQRFPVPVVYSEFRLQFLLGKYCKKKMVKRKKARRIYYTLYLPVHPSNEWYV